MRYLKVPTIENDQIDQNEQQLLSSKSRHTVSMLCSPTEFFNRQDVPANSQRSSSQQQTHQLFSPKRQHASNLSLPTVSAPRTWMKSEVSIERMNSPHQNYNHKSVCYLDRIPTNYDNNSTLIDNSMSIQRSMTTTPVVVRLSRSSSFLSNSPYTPTNNTAMVNNNNIASHQNKKFTSKRLLKEAQLLLRRSWPNPFVQG
ncbi:unnamed protein product, partial [Didymodactylos carnosus]